MTPLEAAVRRIRRDFGPDPTGRVGSGPSLFF